MNIGLKWLGALALGSALSACYVVPVSSNMRVVGTSTSAAPVAINNTLQARLYPTNAIAERTGAARATVTIDQSGHGVFTSVIGGEQFTGDATRESQSRSGKANGASATGRYINCDYQMNSTTLGTGSCRMSTGATYTMHITR